MKKFSVLVMALAVSVLAGCSNKIVTTNDKYSEIASEHKKIYIELDENGYVFDYVLEQIDDYIAGKISGEKIVSCVENTIDDFEKQLEEMEPYILDEQFSATLTANDIIPKDFEQFANFRVFQLTEMVDMLKKVNNVLADNDGSQMENLKIINEKYSNIHENYKKYYFYGCFNYFFASWGDAQTKYVRDEIVPDIKEYIEKEYIWQNDKEVLNQNVAGYLAEISNDLKAVEELNVGETETVEEAATETTEENE